MSSAWRLAVVGLLTARPAAGQAARAEAIVGQAIEAMGGRAALERVQTRYARGTVEVLGGYLGPFESWAKAPNRLRTRWDIKVIGHELGFDGLAGWERQKTVRELPRLDRLRAARRAMFAPLLEYARSGRPKQYVMSTLTVHQIFGRSPRSERFRSR